VFLSTIAVPFVDFPNFEDEIKGEAFHLQDSQQTLLYNYNSTSQPKHPHAFLTTFIYHHHVYPIHSPRQPKG